MVSHWLYHVCSCKRTPSHAHPCGAAGQQSGTPSSQHVLAGVPWSLALLVATAPAALCFGDRLPDVVAADGVALLLRGVHFSESTCRVVTGAWCASLPLVAWARCGAEPAIWQQWAGLAAGAVLGLTAWPTACLLFPGADERELLAVTPYTYSEAIFRAGGKITRQRIDDCSKEEREKWEESLPDKKTVEDTLREAAIEELEQVPQRPPNKDRGFDKFLYGSSWPCPAPSPERRTIFATLGSTVNNFRGVDLTRKNFSFLELRQFQLQGAVLSRCYLVHTSFAKAHLEGAMLDGAHLEGANFEEAHLEGASFSGAHLDGAKFRKAHLEGTDLCEANLEGANFEHAHLEGAFLWRAHLEGAHFNFANLEGAEVYEAHLEGAKFTWAHLEGADFQDAHLEGANFVEAHLEGARFLRAHLEGALFYGAHLEGTDLRFANLEGAKLEDAHMGTVVNKDRAFGLDDATFEPVPAPKFRKMPESIGICRVVWAQFKGSFASEEDDALDEDDAAGSGGDEGDNREAQEAVASQTTEDDASAPLISMNEGICCASCLSADQVETAFENSLNEVMDRSGKALSDGLEMFFLEKCDEAAEDLCKVLDRAETAVKKSVAEGMKTANRATQNSAKAILFALQTQKKEFQSAVRKGSMNNDNCRNSAKAKFVAAMTTVHGLVAGRGTFKKKLMETKQILRETAGDSNAAATLLDKMLTAATGYQSDGLLSLARNVLFQTPGRLTAAEKELERLKEDVLGLVAPITVDTWVEVADSISVFHLECRQLRTQRAQAVAAEIWSDLRFRKDAGAAKALHDINGDASEGLLKIMKRMTSTVKMHKNSYIIAIEKEIIAINNIRSYQEKLGVLIANIFLSIFIAVANHVFNYGGGAPNLRGNSTGTEI